jgi:hypothetical protein
LQKITGCTNFRVLIEVLIIVALKWQQPVTAGDISRPREVKRQGSFFTFFLLLMKGFWN